MARAASVVVLLFCVTAVSHAQTFRGSVGAQAGRATLEEEYVKLGGDKAEVLQFQEALLPFWQALPKNQMGNLEYHSARYVLHRLFVQRHGWYIKGLEPQGNVWTNALRAGKLADWVPAPLLEALEGRSGSHGLSLTDLAVLGAAVKHRNHEEIHEFMGDMYSFLHFPTRIPNPVSKVQEVIWYYVARYLSGRVYTPSVAFQRAAAYIGNFTDWNKTEAWYKAIEHERLGDSSAANFTTAVSVAEDIGERYSAFNDVMCQDLKASLMGMWSKAKTTGRVRLADYYSNGLSSQWAFNESPGYLKSLGALDDSNASSLMVIIPNYLTGRPNCIETTQLYAVCCRNECEDLLGHLERSIAAPSAEPARIAELIANLQSDTVVAPREISLQMRARLSEIAEVHGGQVHLHGRLFAQWMHHAYPNECPYPQTIEGNSSFTSPDEWIGSEEASEAERLEVVEAEKCSAEQAAEEWTAELPWSDTEVLLSSEAHHRVQSSGRASVVRYFMFVLLVFALGVARLPKAAPLRHRLSLYMARRGWSWPQVLLAALLLLAIACNLANRVILLLGFCAMFASSRLLTSVLGDCKSKKSMELCI